MARSKNIRYRHYEIMCVIKSELDAKYIKEKLRDMEGRSTNI